jgi:hypothetical protein
MDEPARVVRDRRPGEAPLDALHRHLRSALERRDPVSGLCDHPAVVRFYRFLLATPTLTAALARYHTRGEEALTGALLEAVPGSALPARLAAAQILATLRILGDANQTRIAGGRTADDLAAEALAEADAAFDLLRSGLAPYRGVSPAGSR